MYPRLGTGARARPDRRDVAPLTGGALSIISATVKAKIDPPYSSWDRLFRNRVSLASVCLLTFATVAIKRPPEHGIDCEQETRNQFFWSSLDT